METEFILGLALWLVCELGFVLQFGQRKSFGALFIWGDDQLSERDRVRLSVGGQRQTRGVNLCDKVTTLSG